MQDRLVWLLQRFDLRASTFQSGALHCDAAFEAEEGKGHLHLLRAGAVELKCHHNQQALRFHQPTLFFFINPEAHSLRPLGEGTSMVCASFEFGLSEGNPLLHALPEMVAVKIADVPLLGLTLKQLFAEATDRHCGGQAILDRLCEVTLILLLRDLMDQKRLEVGLLAGLAHPRLARAINAMHADPAKDWTLEKLASVAGMSRARFAIHFKNIVGKTPGLYLAEWRVGLTQSLLLKGKPINVIADEVGYSSASALSRAFTAQRGVSPSRWLKSKDPSRPKLTKLKI